MGYKSTTGSRTTNGTERCTTTTGLSARYIQNVSGERIIKDIAFKRRVSAQTRDQCCERYLARCWTVFRTLTKES